MSEAGFILDPRLAADTHAVASLALCDVRLMDDARYAWLVLVPRRAGLVEICDLDAAGQSRLWEETRQASEALRGVAPCDKLNLGALGNIVRQLHLHAVARCEGDAAWPGPVWGHGKPIPRTAEARSKLIDALRRQLAG